MATNERTSILLRLLVVSMWGGQCLVFFVLRILTTHGCSLVL